MITEHKLIHIEEIKISFSYNQIMIDTRGVNFWIDSRDIL